MKMTTTEAVAQLRRMLKSLKEMPACGAANVSYVVYDLSEDVKELREWQRLAVRIGRDSDWLPPEYVVALEEVGDDLGGKFYAKWSSCRGILRKLERANAECGWKIGRK
jgi:hypothetical protein